MRFIPETGIPGEENRASYHESKPKFAKSARAPVIQVVDFMRFIYSASAFS
jgi:hypothetical protein